MHNNKRTILLISLTALVMGIMFMSGALLANDLLGQHAGEMKSRSMGIAEANLSKSSDTIANIVEQAGPAVVKINTTSYNNGYDDPAMRYFFGDKLPSERQREQGVGSGFIISEDGLVITNQHVIDGAAEITVTVGNGQGEKDYQAEVVGSDYDLDLALLQIKGANDLPHLKLGDSQEVKVGNWVVAIGNPFGFDHTVTAGVISAKERPITVQDRHYKNLFQTDAAINPGNSGGPLLNLEGEVIGINTAVANAQGIGFAIPSNTVKDAMESLENGENESQSWLGVQMAELTSELAGYYGLESTEGVIIVGVIPGSPAEKAGLRQEDIILKLNGENIKDTGELAAAIQDMKVGEKGTLSVYRDERIINIQFTVGEKPARLN